MKDTLGGNQNGHMVVGSHTLADVASARGVADFTTACIIGDEVGAKVAVVAVAAGTAVAAVAAGAAGAAGVAGVAWEKRARPLAMPPEALRTWALSTFLMA